MAAILFPMVSATYSVPFRPRPTPVGPMTRAEELVSCGNPEPIVVSPISLGSPRAGVVTISRSTVPRRTTLPPPATVPLSTLVTNKAETDRPPTAVMSQGPLMP